MELGPLAARALSVRVFVEPSALVRGELQLLGEEHHYLTRVRRQEVGATICLLDGDGRWADAEIIAIDEQSTTIRVALPQQMRPATFSLSVAPALIKGERMDQAISKMVELGVQRISPLTTEHTIVRLVGERAGRRLARFRSVCKAAARQSRNARPPSIDPIRSFEDFLAQASQAELKLIPETASGNAPPLAKVLPSTPPRSAVALIGPEGGFSTAELVLAKDAGFTPVSLGPRILRAETACISITAMLMFRYGDLGLIHSDDGP